MILDDHPQIVEQSMPTFAERRKCAQSILLRGVVTAVICPHVGVAAGALNGIGGSPHKIANPFMLAANMLTGFFPAAAMAGIGAGTGAAIGTVSLIDALLGAPYQLIKKGRPESTTRFQRYIQRLTNS